MCCFDPPSLKKILEQLRRYSSIRGADWYNLYVAANFVFTSTIRRRKVYVDCVCKSYIK